MKLVWFVLPLIASVVAHPVGENCVTVIPPTVAPPSDNFHCADTPKNAWVDLVIVIELSNVMAESLLEIQNNLKAYLKQLTISNSGQHTSRIAIIGYNENNATLIHAFTDEQSFGAVAGKVDGLQTSKVKSDKATIVKGLQLAKNHIDAAKSERIPGVVLYAATYNDKDDSDPQVAAHELKGDMIKVGTITFKTILGVYTTEIAKLASDGLAFNSTTVGGFGTAVARLNCVCPREWTQLIITEPATNAVTVYAECFKAYESEAEPDILTCPENGYTVAVHTNERLSFLKNQILPSLSESAAVSVGLFRDSSSAWKWHTIGGVIDYGSYPAFNPPAPNDQYGYLDTKNNWALRTDDGSKARAYICSRRSCDTDNICDLNIV